MFARDFLEEMGFYIESSPDRGADGGMDILASEEVVGRLHRYKFRWVVSCKHFAHSKRAVNENEHERNILERVRGFGADGFLGFYSTLASSGLNSRLRVLRNTGDIKDYKILDYCFIENFLVTTGFSELMIRYFPESYKQVKPLHSVTDKYEPLKCEVCGKDLLLQLFEKDYSAVIAQIEVKDEESGNYTIEDVYSACKGECDRILDRRAAEQGKMTGWLDLSDMAIPLEYLSRIFAMMNNIRSDSEIYTDEAFHKQKIIMIKLAQKVLRYTTTRERNRYKDLLEFPF